MDILLGVSWSLASSSTFTNIIAITNHHLFGQLRQILPHQHQHQLLVRLSR
jgi:hypothetical protein